MATTHHDLTNVPTDVIAELGLTVGLTYSGRYVGGSPTNYMLYVEADSDPDPDDGGTPIQTFEDLIIKPASGEGVYVWTESGTGRLWINEVS